MIVRTLGAAAMLLLTTSLSQAAFNANDVAAQLASDGYTRIEIKVGENVAKVEAIKGTIKIEVTYDIASGDIIKSETQAVDASEDTTPGVEIRDNDVSGPDGDDDGPNHDVNDDNGGGNDDANDDHGGNSGSGGDDGEDDHSGSGHNGDDDGDDD